MGSYKIESMKQAIVEIKIFGVYCLGNMPFYKHDLEGTIKIFCLQHNISWQYTHETWLHEEEYKRPLHYKRSNPNWGKSGRLLREKENQGR